LLIEPLTMLLVKGLNMVRKPVEQKAQEGADRDSFAVLNVVDRIEHLREEALMLGAMLGHAGEPRLFHKALFALEVHLREFDQPVQQPADMIVVTAAQNRRPQFVHGIQDVAVLIVHSSYSDSTGVVQG
jgi:hypothetical protein